MSRHELMEHGMMGGGMDMDKDDDKECCMKKATAKTDAVKK